MAGTCVEKIECSSCGSSDGKQVFLQEDGTYDATCFACNQFDPDPYKDGVPPKNVVYTTDEDKAKQVKEVFDTFPVRALEGRSINRDICEYLDIRVGVSRADGSTVLRHYYPSYNGDELTGYEVRILEPKRFFGLGNRRDIDMFGWQQATRTGGKKLFIAEDALSAASVLQAIREYSANSAFKDHWPAVVALPKGAASAAQAINRHREEIQATYGEVILLLDQDDAGSAAEDTIIQMLSPMTVKICRLPEKDPNDMLMGGRSSDLAKIALFRSTIKRNDGVKEVSDFLEAVAEPPVMGISWPWPTVTKETFGIRPAEVHIIGAAPKIGKTDHQHQLATHLVDHHKLTIGLFDLENSGAKTLRRLVGKIGKKAYHRPDVYADPKEIEEMCRKIDGKVKFYDSTNDREWSAVKSAIVSMNKIDGVQYFFIDPLTALISMMEASEANDALNAIMTEITELAQKLPATFFLYSHVNPPRTGKPHEEGGKVLSSQFTGSRAMEKWANYGWGIERDRLNEDGETRNTSILRLLFDREYGSSAIVPIVYDADTNSYLEPTDDYEGGF